jgi:hypothetical protein
MLHFETKIIRQLTKNLDKLKNIHVFELLLLFEIIGFVFFFINANQLFEFNGVLLISVVLFVFPSIYVAIFDTNNRISRYQSLLLLFILIVLINYIYYIRIGLPAGFQDVHDHLFQTEHLFVNGHIMFDIAKSVSFNFVSLYTIHHSLTSICNVETIWTAVFIPPIFNIICALFAYLFVNRLFSHKVAIIATLFYALENTVIYFGQELRTQTMGTLILFGMLLVMIMIYSNKNMSKSVILVLFLAALATTAFVPWFYTLILFIGILIACLIFEKKISALLTRTTFFLFLVFFFAYILYIGTSLESVMGVFTELFEENFVESALSATPDVGQVIYGDFIKWFTYSFWGLFIVSSLYYIKKIFSKEMNIFQIAFFGSFSFLFAFCYIASIFGSLSPGRVYIVVMLLIGIVISYVFLKIIPMVRNKKFNLILKTCISIFIILFVSTSLAKFPSGIIGNTQPIRGYTNIDDYEYWYVDDIDYTPSFFSMNYVNNKSLYLHMTIQRHMFMNLYDQNKHPNQREIEENASLYERIEKNSVIILQNAEHGEKFAGRERYDSEIAYNNAFVRFYSNQDYYIYYKY